MKRKKTRKYFAIKKKQHTFACAFEKNTCRTLQDSDAKRNASVAQLVRAPDC